MKHVRGLIRIVFGLAATNLVGLAQAETITLWCGDDQTGYNGKYTVDLEKSLIVEGGPTADLPASINAYRIAWETRQTTPWHGGVAITLNQWSIDRVTGILSFEWRSWVEDDGDVQDGTVQGGRLQDRRCVKGDKPPAPVTKF